jgi:hypothetical protein
VSKLEQCEVCGATTPLHAAHVLPLFLGGAKERSNLVYLCSNCHAQMDLGILREFEFVRVLTDLMRQSGAYVDIATEADVSPDSSGSRLRPDIIATTSNEGRRVLIECKSAPTVTQGRLREAIAQMKRYQEVVHADDLILALPARLTPGQRRAVEVANIEAWDLDTIASKFLGQLGTVTHPVLRPLLLGVAALAQPTAGVSAEASLLAELRGLPPGPTAWSAYQKLISRILERVFCPPLSAPITELSDDARANRRDIILPNYAESGFWAFIRDRYCADFLVVDAKNHTSTVGKVEALQIINYLKRYGAGLLGMIISRAGPDAACLHTIREHWAHEGKLVVVLADDHVERMLRAKEAGGPPEDVIRQWIEDFRLAL